MYARVSVCVCETTALALANAMARVLSLLHVLHLPIALALTEVMALTLALFSVLFSVFCMMQTIALYLVQVLALSLSCHRASPPAMPFIPHAQLTVTLLPPRLYG